MFGTFAAIQVFICLLLIVVVLLQEGKKGMGAIFGGSSSSIFGARGAGNVLTKITSVLAILFMLNSVWLSYLSSKSGSVVDSIKTDTLIERDVPVTPSPDDKEVPVSAPVQEEPEGEDSESEELVLEKVVPDDTTGEDEAEEEQESEQEEMPSDMPVSEDEEDKGETDTKSETES